MIGTSQCKKSFNRDARRKKECQEVSQQVYSYNRPICREKVILVVADLRLCFSLMGLILSKTPYEVFFATERYQAVNFLSLSFRPHLFLFDYHLPGMNGLELYDLLHAREELAAIPTIILSNGDPRCQQEITKGGLACVSKPVQPEELLCCLEQYLGISQPESPGAGNAFSSTPEEHQRPEEAPAVMAS
jgi:CheY-like chemotaxis protein